MREMQASLTLDVAASALMRQMWSDPRN